jgi:anti-sigma B factor antagonist
VPLAIETISDDGQLVLAVRGEIDLSNAEQLRTAVVGQALPGRRLVLDLTDVRFMGSPGVTILVEAYRRLDHDRHALVLRRPSPAVRRILEITAIDRLVTIDDKIDVAHREPS